MPPIKKSRNQTKKTNENCVSIALTRNRRRNGNYYQNKTNVSSAIVSDEKMKSVTIKIFRILNTIKVWKKYL